jgi:methionyl aminopeptidase
VRHARLGSASEARQDKRLNYQPLTTSRSSPEARAKGWSQPCVTAELAINSGSKIGAAQTRRLTGAPDGGLSAQFEHTVLMTEHGPEPLTLTKHGPQRGHKF